MVKYLNIKYRAFHVLFMTFFWNCLRLSRCLVTSFSWGPREGSINFMREILENMSQQVKKNWCLLKHQRALAIVFNHLNQMVVKVHQRNKPKPVSQSASSSSSSFSPFGRKNLSDIALARPSLWIPESIEIISGNVIFLDILNKTMPTRFPLKKGLNDSPPLRDSNNRQFFPNKTLKNPTNLKRLIPIIVIRGYWFCRKTKNINYESTVLLFILKASWRSTILCFLLENCDF